MLKFLSRVNLKPGQDYWGMFLLNPFTLRSAPGGLRVCRRRPYPASEKNREVSLGLQATLAYIPKGRSFGMEEVW